MTWMSQGNIFYCLLRSHSVLPSHPGCKLVEAAWLFRESCCVFKPSELKLIKTSKRLRIKTLKIINRVKTMILNHEIRKIIYSGKSTRFTNAEKRLAFQLENFDSLSLKDQIDTAGEFYVKILWSYGQVLGLNRMKIRIPTQTIQFQD